MMKVNCNFCGASNKLHPGQKILFCEFCGSAIAPTEYGEPDHLILPHQRNDKMAREMLISFLKTKNRRVPGKMNIDFSFIPFFMEENDSIRNALQPANSSIDIKLPHPPAGDYRFFDSSLADKERIIPIDKEKKNTRYILHLPIYRINYQTPRGEWTAYAIGQSWQILADHLPTEEDVSVNMVNLLAAAALMIIYLFMGKLAPKLPGTMAIIFLASLTGFSLYKIRDRMVKRE
jgi:hypothetical protein